MTNHFTRAMADALIDAFLLDGEEGSLPGELHRVYGQDTIDAMLAQHLFIVRNSRLVLSAVGKRVAATLEPATERWDFQPGGELPVMAEEIWDVLSGHVVDLIRSLSRLEKLERTGKRCQKDDTCEWAATLEFKIVSELSGERSTVRTCIRHPYVTNDLVTVVEHRDLPNRGSKTQVA